jgi:hypothetical protein
MGLVSQAKILANGTMYAVRNLRRVLASNGQHGEFVNNGTKVPETFNEFPVLFFVHMVETSSGERNFAEDAWIGQVLAMGDSVRLSVTGPCPRCVMTTLPQGDLPKDTGILRTAAQRNKANVGIYAFVVEGGTVRRGDSVRVESAQA